MKRLLLLSILVLASLVPASRAMAQAPKGDEAAIRTAMTTQTDAWNRGDIPSFMQQYDNSPDTTFVGSGVQKGYQPILERYQKNYSSKDQMGTLSFTDLDVRLVPSSCGATDLAVVTGKFHLDRSAHGESKKDEGIFSLVWRKGPQGWKIILDHTS